MGCHQRVALVNTALHFNHYKNNRCYQLLDIAIYSGDRAGMQDTPMAVYRDTDTGVVFVRPADEFFGYVESKGNGTVIRRRFTPNLVKNDMT